MTSTLDAPQAKAVKKKASKSSFYLAMRLMPEAERDAMFAIYAFCRKVDDIADDGVGTREERRRRLDGWRDDIAALYRGEPAGQAQFLSGIVTQYGLRQEDFIAVLDGMAMDVAEDIVAPDLATLLGGWGTPSGDVNGDGTTNATDLSAMLSSWGPCP